MSGLLIVGASQAGVQLACSARELGWDRPVTIIGAEPHPPYARPSLSKAFLKSNAASLELRSAEFYAEHDIELVLGEAVTELRSDAVITASGRRLGFERLALATGSRPRRLPIDGAELPGVHVLRGLDDAQALRAELERAPEVVVIGGGFVGLEVAGTAAALGCRVVVLEAGPALMGRAVGSATAEFVRRAHERSGIEVRTGALPQRIVGGDRVAGVELADGTRFRASLVVVGVGVEPVDELARGAGLKCDNGVVVDEFSVTSDGRTLAVGDCANLPDPSPVPGPSSRLRLESVDNAVEQARAAATTLVGDPRPYRGVPWFWSEQPSAKLQIAGLAATSDEEVVRPALREGQQTVLRYRDGVLVAAECVNAPAEFLAARRAIAGGTPLSADTARLPGKLKDVLAART